MRLLGLFLLLAGFFLILWMAMGQSAEAFWDVQNIRSLLDGAEGWAWLVGIGLLVSDILLPVPGTVVMTILGAVYGIFLGGICSATGSFLAGICAYGLGKIITRKQAIQWLGKKDFGRGEKLFEAQGGLIIALSRSLPILPEVLTCLAGLLKMPFQKFCLALACGALPMGFLFSAIGAWAISEPKWGIIVSVCVPGLLWVLAGLVTWRTLNDQSK